MFTIPNEFFADSPFMTLTANLQEVQLFTTKASFTNTHACSLKLLTGTGDCHWSNQFRSVPFLVRFNSAPVPLNNGVYRMNAFNFIPCNLEVLKQKIVSLEDKPQAFFKYI